MVTVITIRTRMSQGLRSGDLDLNAKVQSLHQIKVSHMCKYTGEGGEECAITERNIPLNELRHGHLDIHQMVPARTFPAKLAI